MTMHADQLVGAPVIDSNGEAVGTVEQVFRDDVDGTPSWARIRSHTGLHFVPLAGGRMTGTGGLTVPFDLDKILREPDLKIDRHMSVDQEEELRKYFGVSVPAPAPPGDEASGQAGREAAGPGMTQPGMARPGTTKPGTTQPDMAQPGAAQPGTAARPGQAGEPAAGEGQSTEWLTRSEERIAVTMETRETSRVTLRKRIDTEPVQQTVRAYHEEYEIERVPIGQDDQASSDLAEREQQVILHEARPVISKETVPVERVRLSVKKVEDEKTVSGELRKERIEIDSGADQPGGSQGKR